MKNKSKKFNDGGNWIGVGTALGWRKPKDQNNNKEI
jgi:hypothetical protein|tara:strand:+ start:231 stop:338 length:108 start_codon:yes stop_codon:yes gene_type:complete